MESTGLGTLSLPEGGRVDFARLRMERRKRLFDEMVAAGLDALVLARPANVTYASGARQLWTAGARPSGPACVVVGSTGRVHLLSVWDEGVPDDIAREELYGLSWNPGMIAASVRGVRGLADAGRIGTDSLSPGFASLLQTAAPGAEVVDATPALRAARSTKTLDEQACVATATAAAESGMQAMVEALRAGITERELLGVLCERLAALGLPTPASESVACVTTQDQMPRLRRIVSDRPVAPGDLVALDAGALFAGYEGGLARTLTVPPLASSDSQHVLAARCRDALDAVIAACRPGTTGAELKAAWEGGGATLPPVPLLHGVGLGMEPPVVAPGVGDDAVLSPGMTVSVTGWVAAEGAGGVLERDVILITEAAPVTLSRSTHAPAARPGTGAAAYGSSVRPSARAAGGTTGSGA